ncbi:hypothetical protein H0H93_011564 [Arthromyces matolae]|nr:hypothetical protein H0H93_011564 [Arthromyces matolae]
MSNVEWDSQTVIGFKRQTAKVAKTDSELNAVRLRSDILGNKANTGTDHQRIAKLDRENEVAPPTKVAPNVGRAIQDGRTALKLSQKDLAQKVNEKPSVIQDYESGKAIPNAQILGKMERILGIKLRGSDIGKKLEAKKSSS